MRTLYLAALVALVAASSAAPAAEPQWDLLIRNGHVIDPKNGIDGVRDVAILQGRIARVAANLPAASAKTVVDATGLYVTPGLLDIHVHVYTGTGMKALTGDLSVYPDGFSFRTGVTTMVDAGTSGWRNFADFRQRVIARAKTRVLALINIVADGMSPAGENDPALMNPAEAARVAKANADVVVGYKTAHYSGRGWASVDAAVEAGRLADLPVMVDFGYVDDTRSLKGLLEEKLRPGDIYTHCYSGHRGELLENGKVNPAMIAGRKRGVIFDLGHGGGSFYWNIAAPAFEQGFLPDSISTDLHTGSMNSGMKDLPNVMSKVLNLGVPLAQVIRMSTWNPAREIKRPDLGQLSEGAEADVTVLRVEKGAFGFLDSAGARRSGDRKLVAEMTNRRGVLAWDLNGRAATDWKSFVYRKRATRP
jgi:dihydroorotase